MRLQPSRGQENCFLWFHCCVALFWYYVLRVKKFRYEIEKSVGCFHVLKLNELRKSKILPDISLLLFYFGYLD